MLIEFYGQNFGCFRDEFRLSMMATDIDPDSDRGIMEVKVEGDDEPLRLVRTAAIYGPNASGKSTVLRAARALRYNLTPDLRSDSPLRFYEPFAQGGKTEPVRLGLKAVIEGRVYDYEIQFDKTKFTSERLLLLKSDGPIPLLKRLGQNVEGEWAKDARFALISKDFRPNASLLSLADRLAPDLAGNIAADLRKLLHFFDSSRAPWDFNLVFSPTRRIREDVNFRGWLLSQLKSADFGVVDMRTEEVKVTVQVAEEASTPTSPAEEPEEPETFYRLALLHSGSSGEFAIPFHRESQGTLRLLELAPMLYDLTHGLSIKAAFVDEIHESLHPKLLQGLIRHFNCDTPLAEARGQLIFATHETSLLDAEAKNAVLRRDQIYFTEKDSSGAARLYSLAEFKERNNLNIRRRYLLGRYGAVPSLGSFTE